MAPKVGFMCIDCGSERNDSEIWAIFQILTFLILKTKSAANFYFLVESFLEVHFIS